MPSKAKKRTSYKKAALKLYHGYGHQQNMVIYGHSFAWKSAVPRKLSKSWLVNIWRVLRLFFVKPLPCARLQMHWQDQLIQTQSEDDGFFKFEWKSVTTVEAGWHDVVGELLDDKGQAAVIEKGTLFIPHTTQYGFISDIDDTILISHSASISKRLRVLFTR